MGTGARNSDRCKCSTICCSCVLIAGPKSAFSSRVVSSNTLASFSCHKIDRHSRSTSISSITLTPWHAMLANEPIHSSRVRRLRVAVATSLTAWIRWGCTQAYFLRPIEIYLEENSVEIQRCHGHGILIYGTDIPRSAKCTLIRRIVVRITVGWHVINGLLQNTIHKLLHNGCHHFKISPMIWWRGHENKGKVCAMDAPLKHY